MYAQAEELRNPSLAGRPLAVTQKYLVVTCNYAARARGVTKLMATAEARKRCPELVTVAGEDLTPYRAAAKAVLGVLQRFGPAERLGGDEVFVDVTAEVDARLRAAGIMGGGDGYGGGVIGAPAAALLHFHGHVHRGAAAVVADSRHRPQDLRAPPGMRPAGVLPPPAPAPGAAQPGEQQQPERQQQPQGGGDPAAAADDDDDIFYSGSPAPAWAPRLAVGSAIASEARAAMRAETGFRASAGVACNKLLAKLVSGLHKPDDQTVLPPPEAWVSGRGGAVFVGEGGGGRAADTALRLQPAAAPIPWLRTPLPSAPCFTHTRAPPCPKTNNRRSSRRCRCARSAASGTSSPRSSPGSARPPSRRRGG